MKTKLIVTITGAQGAGKTLLAESMQEWLKRNKFFKSKKVTVYEPGDTGYTDKMFKEADIIIHTKLAEANYRQIGNYEDSGYSRRAIPVEFENYIAKSFGYETLDAMPKNQIAKTRELIKSRFTETNCTVRIAYGRSMERFKRGDDENPLDFVKRVDQARYGHNPVSETRISGTVPGDIMISGAPFDEPLPPIPGDAETLSLSDLKPETVKQVAAELLEQEKGKTRSNEKLALLGMRYGRASIDPYATPVFDLKSMGKPIQGLDEVVKKWREAYAALKLYDSYLYEGAAVFASRFGQSILDAIPKKHAYSMPISEEDSFKIWMKTGDSEKLTESNERRFWPIPETGPEQIIDRSGKTRTAPDLKIETNQQWSPEELKNWIKAQPGNTKQKRKPYFNPDLTRPYREPVAGATSNDGKTWADMKIRNYTPETWPAAAPPYHSTEGWEFEKAMKVRQLKSMLTIEWLEKQQTEKHALVAQRLREILAA